MFKRVEKRRRKQEKEEELGLTEDMKEVLGMHDTDSDESDSSSDNDSGSDSDSGGSNDGDAPDVQFDIAPSDEDEDPSDEREDDEEEEDSEDEPSHLVPQMSVTEAMKDPVYTVSHDPDIQACALCPGKLLKNPHMAEIHKSSKAHYRRFARFVEFAGDADPETNVSDFWDTINAKSVNASVSKEQLKEGAPLSKRAEKRKAKATANKEKRAKAKAAKAKGIAFKAEQKAKKLAAAKAEDGSEHESESNSKLQPAEPSSRNVAEPPKKRRKVEKASSEPTNSTKQPQGTPDEKGPSGSSLTPKVKSKSKSQLLTQPAKTMNKTKVAIKPTVPSSPDLTTPSKPETSKGKPKFEAKKPKPASDLTKGQPKPKPASRSTLAKKTKTPPKKPFTSGAVGVA